MISITGVSKSQELKHFSTKDLELIRVLGETIKNNHIDYDLVQSHLDSRFSNMLLQQLDPRGLYLLSSDTSNINAIFKTWDFSLSPEYFITLTRYTL